jgi:hypothetical protein
MRTSTAYGAVLVAALLALAPATAQSQWAVEGRLGATIPTGDLSDLDQTAGLGFSGELMYTMQRNLTLYGGVGHHRFTCDGCDVDVSTTGLAAGLKYVLGGGGSPAALPWIRGGLMLHRPSFDGNTGDWGAGLDSGIGIDWNVKPSFYLVPALRFNTYSSEDLSLRYLTIDLGAHFHLGG